MATNSRFTMTAKCLLLSFLVIDDLTNSLPKQYDPSPTPVCRDRYGPTEVALFRQRACVLCYHFLFVERETELVSFPPWFHFIRIEQESNETEVQLTPDPFDETTLEEVCRTLPTISDCSRWRQCCLDGAACCERQIRNTPKSSHDDDVRYAGHCPSTWDGYTCWDRTPAGSNATQWCPAFMTYSIPTQKSVKTCSENGTWSTNNGSEWTDFKPCLDSVGYLTGVHVCVSLCVLSLVMLIPAVAIFTLFRDLFRQDRIRLHIHFFVSMILVNVANIAWYMLVHKELIVSLGDDQSVIQRNPVWCRLLSFSKLYLSSTNYFWMFCEGYHLHRLISNAFEAPTTMLGLYVIGWVLPSVGTIIYACVRATIDNNSCWSTSVGLLEWIIYLPNLICLVANLLFLCNILRTLLFQLHAHPHEPSNFRRGLKAGFMLIPLFGIQLLLTIYSPDFGIHMDRILEILTFVVTNSQGIFISLIFCFFNGEVLAQFRRILPCARKRDDWLGGASHATHVTVAEARREDVVPTVTMNDVTPGFGRDTANYYEGYSEAIPMQEVKSQSPGPGYLAVPSKAVD